MPPVKPVIVVHGGAGDWPSELHKQGLNGVRIAADLGFQVLCRGGSALDAVQASIIAMEDNPVFKRSSSLSGSTVSYVINWRWPPCPAFNKIMRSTLQLR